MTGDALVHSPNFMQICKERLVAARQMFLFGFVVSSFGIAVLQWLHPEQSMDEIAVAVAIPWIVLYVSLRSFFVFLVHTLTPPQKSTEQAKTQWSTEMVLVLVITMLILMSILVLAAMGLSMPLYWALNMSWAITQAMAMMYYSACVLALIFLLMITALAIKKINDNREQIERFLLDCAPPLRALCGERGTVLKTLSGIKFF